MRIITYSDLHLEFGSVQELMRHANISVTLNVYAQAITQTKRDAQSRVVSLLLDKNDEKTGSEQESVKSCILRGFPKGTISAPSAARTAHSRQNGR